MADLGFDFNPGGIDFNSPEAYHRSTCKTQYSDAQWEAIVKLLPGRSPSDLQARRHGIENKANLFTWHGRRTQPTIKEMQHDWRNVERCAQALWDALDQATDEDWYKSGLYQIKEWARREIELYSDAPSAKKPGRKDWRIDALIENLLLLWMESGGELKTSVDPRTGFAGGPLIRFLVEATGPLLDAADVPILSPEALRGRVVRYQRKRRATISAMGKAVMVK